ncbi:hypothetical protein [Streptomyces sp. NPDC050804]|uniref:hypothetical protein n=1 Tax=Streptomyces sp. NPDC050804 TaxID=3154745 RepID=UPI003417B4A2
MSAEVAELVKQAGPYVVAALGAYGGAVLTRAEDAAADVTANLGRRVLQTIWRRRSPDRQAALEAAVQDAAEGTADEDALAALRQQLKRALREDPELAREVAFLLPGADERVSIWASGERAIAAQWIGTATTGDNSTVGK